MLVEAIWGPEAGDGSRKTLQVFVSSLRKALNACEPGAGARLAFEGGGYRLDVDAETIDIFRFEQLASRARAHLAGGRPEQAVPLLDEALSLWRGPALADFAYESWAQPHVSRLDEAHAGCLEDRVDALLQLGRHSELVGDLEARIAQDPLRERPRGQLMLALYRAGRQADALAAYQDARDALVGQLGIEPSPELRDLHRGILAQDPALSPPPQRPPRADEAAPLPIPATRLVGRQREAVELSELLQHGDAQLITLTGAGGTGKTRLSIEVGTRVSDHFEDGVHWVPLDSIRDAGLFLPTLASTLGTEQRGGTLVDVICDRLAGRRVLVIIDNAEHLLPDVATDVASLRSGCPSATWLVTSRERLRVLGERVYPVQPLAPDDAARLFTARAHDSGVSVDVDEGVNELCRRLDGLPLAIELAAACMPSFTPSQLLSRLSDSPELLTGGRDVDSRQRTLRAAIGWSYDLLGDQERRLFARLAVFSGGCVLEAAEQVCEADLGALASLVETSLVHRVGERFAMLETIRQYALERLEASTQVEPLRERHQEWCLALCERLAPDLKGPLAGERFDQLEAEHANLQAALQHALDNGSAEAALRMTGALWSYWHVRGHWSEGRRWLESALAIATSSGTGWHVESHLGAGIMAAWQGDWTIAAAHADALLALGSKREIPRAEGLGLKLHGLLATFRGDYPRSIALHERVLPIAEAEDDQPGSAPRSTISAMRS